MASRFFSDNDLKAFDAMAKELVNNVVAQECIVYQISAEHTETNIYGEASKGKIYKPGVKVNALIESEDFSFETDEFGPDSNQAVTFAFQRKNLIDINLKPEIGDVINWNYAYFEINSINENMLIGGDVDKNFDLVCTTHLTRLSRVNLTERQQ
tara:strand:- start:6722 stop:7183 length:462 start_codon:yes stop_codon:yes gene_type:complete